MLVYQLIFFFFNLHMDIQDFRKNPPGKKKTFYQLYKFEFKIPGVWFHRIFFSTILTNHLYDYNYFRHSFILYIYICNKNLMTWGSIKLINFSLVSVKNEPSDEPSDKPSNEFIFTTVFLPQLNLETDEKSKKNQPKFICEHCGYTTYSKYCMSRHVKARHMSHYSLKTNENEVVKKVFKCPDCDRCYSHASSLRTHRRYDCGKFPQFHCMHCNYVTKHKYDLNKHTRTRHQEDVDSPMHVCEKCGKTYKHKDSLYHHQRFNCKESTTSEMQK